MTRGFCTMLALGNYGRFMNQGWQIAGILGIARKNGLEPAFPLWQNKWHRDGGFGDVDIDVYKHFVNPLPSIPEGIIWQPEKSIPWGYHDVQLGNGSWNLSGHFQSEKYFAHCLDEIKFYFRMKDEPPLNDYCAIHVRLGDYDNAYHPRLDIDYYGKAILGFPSETKFLVFSDDLQAAKRMFGRAVDYSEGRDYLEDFKLMKTCRHFIIGNSSYSAMAAVLGEAPDKRVICPRPWFGPAYTSIDGEDIYSDNWTVIDWDKAEVRV